MILTDSQYCSEYFLKLWRQKLLNPLLAPGDWMNYLLEQYDLLQTNCSVSMSVTTSASTLHVTPTITSSSVPTTTTVANATNAICFGQLAENQYFTCAQLSDAYNVSIGTVMQVIGRLACLYNNTICLPQPCDLDVITTYTTTW
jgi:hypothetical protein